jgi:2-oxoisovalerate dehydrogenase E2 component (dihydrolipoyl transacylase)
LSEEVFLLPDVGEGLVEAEIVTWKVNVGDHVTLNQPLVDIETAKATVELPSPYEGTVVALHGKVGDVMEVHKPLITFETGNGASGAASSAAATTEAPAAATEPAKEASVGEGREAVLVGYGVANEDGVATRKHRRRGAEAPTPPTPPTPPVESPPSVPAATPPSAAVAYAPRSTPPVRLYAKQHGLDLAKVAGTGRDGVITRDDVDRALNGATSTASTAPARVSAPITGPTTTSRFVGREIESWATGPKEERIPVKGVLRSMAEAMTQSAFTAPHAAVWMRLDATKTIELLASLKQRPSLADVRLSPLTIVALALCDAARHYPGVNSSFDAAAGEVIVRRTVNLGIAADTARGLIVPNIKGADQLDLVPMAEALNVLVDKARNGTTTPDEMLHTTLTITNVGPFGVDAAVPILPPNTGAILAVGKMAKAPWVVDDEVVVRYVAEIAMSFDHRMVDGALASRVLAHVAKFLEDPAAAIIAG